jgi:glutaminyl-peptide cyclotransferase
MKTTPLPAGAIMTMLAAVIVAALAALHAAAPGLLWAAEGSLPVSSYRVIATYPHDRQAYTQGLVYRGGFLYESTGLEGQSTLRKVRPETGEVLIRRSLEKQVFAEGLTLCGDRLVQLTWISQKGFIWDLATLKRVGTFNYTGEGWGLANDKDRLIMSDGTSTLRFLDPSTLREKGRLAVTAAGKPLTQLNELEYVKGEIWANVYQTDRIARISPKTGRVTGWIDLAGLLPEADRIIPVDVLNGIAYDPDRNRLFVTGKLWPKLFVIELVERL